MKRLICLFIALIICPVFSFADLPDISGLSFDELVQLRDQLNLAIWNSKEWQEVIVPAGVWEIGVDIPEGHWTMRPYGDVHDNYWYTDSLDETKTKAGYSYTAFWGDTLSTRKNKDGSWKYTHCLHEISLEMKSGFFVILPADTVFTPYAGKPDLGFK